MARTRDLIMLAILTLPLLGIKCGGSGTEDEKKPTPLPDPWVTKLARYRDEYKQNEAKLLADWRNAMNEAKAENLDTEKLGRDIAGLRRALTENGNKLADWNREIKQELQRRTPSPQN